MGTENISQEMILANQAKELELLRATVARLHERLGPDPDAQPAPTSKDFPKNVYRAQEEPDPKQLDHPGWDTTLVKDQAELDAALAAGWKAEVGEFVYTEPDEQIAVVKKGTRQKK